MADQRRSVADHLTGCVTCRAIQEELHANALALNSFRDEELPSVRIAERRPILPWLAAAAAAVLLVLIAHQGFQQPSPHPQPVTAPVTVTAKLPPAPTLKPPLRRKPKPARRSAQPEQPLLVKMLTPDPDVVVYWIVD